MTLTLTYVSANNHHSLVLWLFGK